MILRVKISTRTAREIQAAAEWWEANRSAAPGAISADFGEAVSLLAEQPGIGSKYEGAKTLGVRRLYLSRVRYFICYKAEGPDLKVLAFWHASREHQPAV